MAFSDDEESKKLIENKKDNQFCVINVKHFLA